MSYEGVTMTLVKAGVGGRFGRVLNNSVVHKIPELSFDKAPKPWESGIIPVPATKRAIRDARPVRTRKPAATTNTILGGRRINQG